MARLKNREPGKVIKQEIIKAAIEVIIRKGFSNTSLNDIAECMGISTPALYWHFENKERLFVEVINHVRKVYIEQIIQISGQTHLKPDEKLSEIVDYFYRQTFEDVNMCVLPMKMLVEFINTTGEFHDLLKGIYTDCIGVIRAVLEEGIAKDIFIKDIDTFYFAMCLVGAMDGILHQCILHSVCNTMEECHNKLIFDNLIQSIMKKEKQT